VIDPAEVLSKREGKFKYRWNTLVPILVDARDTIADLQSKF
jgi:hypothetical protein